MSYSSTILADNPVVYYRLDDTGTTAVNSGTGGTTYNADIGSGVTQSATGLIYNDTDTAVSWGVSATSDIQVASRTTGIEYTSNFSVECWFKAISTTNNGMLVGYCDANGDGPYRLFVGSNGILQWSIYVSGDILTGSGYTVSTGTIYHAVGTYDGSTLKLYVNGNLVASSAQTGAINEYGYAGVVLRIGEEGYGSFYSLNGTVDEVAVYGTALTSTQVSTHYNAGVPPKTYTVSLADGLQTETSSTTSVQVVQQKVVNASNNQPAVTFSTRPATGNLLVAALSSYYAIGATAGNGWTLLETQHNGGSNEVDILTYTVQSTDTSTFNVGGVAGYSGEYSMVVYEVSGFNTGAPINVHNSTGSSTSVSASPTVGGCLAIACGVDGSSTSGPTIAGYTLDNTNNGGREGQAHTTLMSTGSSTANFVFSGSSGLVAAAIVLIAPSSFSPATFLSDSIAYSITHVTQTYTATPVDTLNTVDTVVKKQSIARPSSDTTTTTSTVTDSQVLFRASSSTTTTSDTLTDVDDVNRTLSDNAFGSGSYAAGILADSPLVYYRLDDTGSTALNSGTGGTAYNATVGSSVTEAVTGLVAGDSDTAMTFPAVAYSAGVSSVSTSRLTGIEYTTNFSVECIVTINALGGAIPLVSYTGTGNFPWRLQWKPANFLLFSVLIGGLAKNASSAVLGTGTYHVVGTYDGTAVTVYVNSVATSLAITGSVGGYSTSSQLSIGSAPGLTNTSAVTIDEVAVYSTVLTPAQVASHYNLSIGAGGGGFNDAVGQLMDANRLLLDSTSTSDSLTDADMLGRTSIDTVTTADSLAGISSYARPQSDITSSSAVLSDVVARSRPQTDTLATTDTFSEVRGLNRAFADNFTPSYTVADVQSLQRISSDTVTSSDAIALHQTISRQQTDTSSGSSTVLRWVVGSRSVADSFPALADAIARQASFHAGISATLTSTDALAALQVLYRLVSATGATTDALTAFRGKVAALGDAVSTTDTVAELQTLFREVTASSSTSDTIAAGGSHVAALLDTLTTTDGIVRLSTLLRTTTDTSVFTDTFVRLVAIVRGVGAAFTTSDTVVSVGMHPRATTDTVVVTDAVTRIAAVYEHPSDTVVTTDALSVNGSFLARQVADTVPALTDAITRVATVARGVADTTTTTAALAGMRRVIATLADTSFFGDTVAGSAAMVRGVADATALMDAVERIVSVLRLESDTSVVGSAIAAVRETLRAVTDTTSVSDAVVRVTAQQMGLTDTSVLSASVARSYVAARLFADTSVTIATILSNLLLAPATATLPLPIQTAVTVTLPVRTGFGLELGIGTTEIAALPIPWSVTAFLPVSTTASIQLAIQRKLN